MISIISSVFLLTACIILISSTNAVDLPGNYTLPKSSQNLCFAARFDLTLNVEYLKFDGKKNITKIPLNNETFQSYDGTCLAVDSIHTLTITMLDKLTTITFYFSINKKNQTSLSQISTSITINNNTNYFLNYSKNVEGLHIFLANESLFTTDRSNSYRCNTKTTIANFQSVRNVTITSIDIQNLRIQPFVDTAVIFNNYAVEKVCTMDIIKNSNLIPIIVGVCLGILVIIVLIAYLIGRRRNRNGYQSV